MTAQNKKRVALVGCGTIAKTHGLAIQDLGMQCVAVTDLRPEAAQAYARAYPELRADWLQAAEWMTAPARLKLREIFPAPRAYASLEEMQDAGPLDAVLILTWPPSHCDLTCRAAALGAKAVLCEKPMAMSAAQCDKMIDTCGRHGARLAVYHESMLLLRQFSEARQIVASGQIGPVEFVRANTVSTLMDWSAYLWAGILHLLPGRHITRLQAMLDCTRQVTTFGHAQEDHATVHFTMDNGIHGVLFTGQNGFSPHGIRIDGSQGSLEVSFITAPTLRHWCAGTSSWRVITPPRSCGYDDRRAFLEGVVSADPFCRQFNGVTAKASTLPIFAAWQSHCQRRPMEMDQPLSLEVPERYPVRGAAD